MTQGSEADFSFVCRTCGQEHRGLPDLGFDAPYQYSTLNDEQRATIARKNSDLCSIGEEDFFLRGVVELPIQGRNDFFGLGVWVSVKRENFQKYVELYSSPDPSAHGPWFGWLCNRVVGYPDTLLLKTNVHLRPAPSRPRIELEPTDHPLALHQREGMTVEDVQRLLELAEHSDGTA